MFDSFVLFGRLSGGGKAVDMLFFIANVLFNFVLNFDVINLFLSLMIYSKIP